MKRTHTCGELTSKDDNKKVVLEGWSNTRRDHGGVIFIDLRDRYGLTQVVFDPKHNSKSHSAAEKIAMEDVLRVTGKVRPRKEGMINPNMNTGEIEVIVDELEIINKAETPPIEIDDRKLASEELRMKYRYLDLRRPAMVRNLTIRHNAAQAARKYLSSQNFLEIETPLLVRTTPGGARVYKVPSRVSPGKFYALPESPQIYKQILMVSGIDRYFQLAKCLRDEDLRIDRQPEFTQIDMEMSFVDEVDVQTVIEGMLKAMFKEAINVNLKTPFPRMTYDNAMSKYGSDKPDIRFGLELCDVTASLKNTKFTVFKSVIEKNGKVLCLNAKNCAKFSRTEIEELIEVAKTYKLSGLAWAKVTPENKIESSITKYFTETELSTLSKAAAAKPNDLLLFAAEEFEKAATALGQVRLHLGRKLNLMKNGDYKFLWITEFPLFEMVDDTLQARHHIFTMPRPECMDDLEKDPLKVKGILYDAVLNGVELGSGSIRIHRKDIQEKVLKVIGINYDAAAKTFDFLLEAFKYGAPIHGGFALGFDRICALMCGTNDIREVTAFPKTKAGECLMDGSPQDWTPDFLKELKLTLDVVQKR